MRVKVKRPPPVRGIKRRENCFAFKRKTAVGKLATLRSWSRGCKNKFPRFSFDWGSSVTDDGWCELCLVTAMGKIFFFLKLSGSLEIFIQDFSITKPHTSLANQPPPWMQLQMSYFRSALEQHLWCIEACRNFITASGSGNAARRSSRDLQSSECERKLELRKCKTRDDKFRRDMRRWN